MIEVIPTVARQNNKNSTIALYLDYRTQDIALLAEAVDLPGIVLVLVFVLKPGVVVATPLPVVVAGPLLQVGQFCALDDEPVENGNDLA